MVSARTYDVVVLGAGTTGENVAWSAVKQGLSAVVVESELVGGDCSYWACMPSKALLRPAQALDAARALAGAREAVTGRLDARAVLAAVVVLEDDPSFNARLGSALTECGTVETDASVMEAAWRTAGEEVVVL